MTKKRILSIALCLCMVCSLLPVTALAEATEQASYSTGDSGLTVTPTNGATISVGAADSDTCDVYYDSTNKVLYIKSATKLTISNTDPNTAATDRIVVASGIEGGANITLQNVNVSTTANHAIKAESALNLTLAGENTLTAVGNGSDPYYGVICSKGDIAIGGDGQLNATATGTQYPYGIYSSDGDVIISGDKTMVKATCTGTAGGSGIYSSDGNVTINGGATVTSTSRDSGIYSNGNVTIDGGATVNATSTDNNGIIGSTVIIRGDSKVTAEGAVYGIRGSNGVTISGGSTVVNAKNGGTYGRGICSDGNVTIDGSTVTAEGVTYGIYGSTVTIKGTGTEVNATATRSSGIYSDGGDVTISGNSTVVNATSTEYNGIDSKSGITIEGTSTVTAEGGVCGINSSGNITVGEGSVLMNTGKISVGGTLVKEGTIYSSGTLPGGVEADGTLYGDFAVTDGVKDTDFSYDDGTKVLTIKTNKAITLSTPEYTEVSPSTATISVNSGIEGGANITLNGVHISTTAANAINAESDLNLTLEGENTLTAAGYSSSTYGVICSSGSITIGGSGTLDVTATGTSGRGIYGYTGVTINGGTVTATGDSTGIYSKTGDIKISGAGTVVDATGGTNGICSEKSVTIEGGMVTAEGGNNGIFGFNGNVEISGDYTVVNATGKGLSGISSNSGSVTISGGVITAEGNDGISSNGGSVTISGGTVIADGKQGGIFKSTGITISGGAVTAKSSNAITGGGDVNISGGATLTIPEDSTLMIPNNSTFTNSGTINGNGTIDLSSGGTIGGTGTVAATLKRQYNVSNSLTGISSTGIPVNSNNTAKANDKDGYTATLSAETGYELPASIGMTRGGTAFTGFTYNQSTGAVSIAADEITGNIVITATGVLKAPTINANDFSAIYTGSDQTVSITATHELQGEISYKVYKGSESTPISTTDSFTVKDVADSGTYKIVASITVGTQTATAETEITVTVGKAIASVTTAPTANTLTYTGNPQALVTAGATNDGTIHYSLSQDSGYTAAIPTATDAGSYTVYYKVVGDANHSDSAPASVSVTVSPKEITAPMANTTTYTYNGQVQTYTLTEDAAYTITGNTQTNAGTYTVTVSLKDKTNYVWASTNDTTDKTYSFVIGKVAYSGNPITAAKNVLINKEQTGVEVDLTTAIGGIDGAKVSATIEGTDSSNIISNVRFSGNTVKFNVASVADINKTATINVTIESTNYTAITATITVTTVDKTDAGVSIDGVPTTAKTYGDADFTLTGSVTSAGTGAGVWTWGSSNTNVLTVDKNGKVTIIGAGSATITASYESDTTIGSATSAAITVNRKSIAVPAADTTVYTYNGREQVYAIAADTAYVTITDNKQTNAGTYTVTVALKDKDNTQWSDNSVDDKTYTFVIKKATVTVKAIDRNIYTDGTAPDLSNPTKDTDYTVTGLAEGDTLGGSITMKYQDASGADVASPTAVGSYTIVIEGATAPNDTNYNDVAHTNGTLKISRKSTGGGSYTPTPSKPQNQPNTSESGGWTEIQTELKETVEQIVSGEVQPGETVTVQMNGATEVPGEVLEEIAGKDVNVEFDMGGGVTWTVNGQDIPAGIGDLDLGISTGGNSIPVNIINTVTGETSTVQLELSHDGPFGAVLHLSVNLGDENSGYFANLYYYDEALKELVFKHACRIDAEGNASWPFDHASSYAIVIDDENHDPNWVNPFTDVAEDDWFYSAVEYVNKHGLMQGTADTLFSPSVTTSRGMIVTILWRLEGEPAPIAANPFGDVPETMYYYDAVLWAAENKIVEGWNGEFRPDDPITREELATILWRYAKYKGIDVSIGEDTNILSYNDGMSVSEYAIPAMQWACGEGIVGGYNGNLTPQGNAKRSEAAAMLMRFLSNEEE